MLSNSEQSWQVQDRFLELRSRWMTLIGEHLQDHQGNLLEYWRIEKADSVIVLPIQGVDVSLSNQNSFLLPVPSYRPGVGQATLDFPGGRLLEGQSPEQSAIAILKRELDIAANNIIQLYPLNSQAWMVNSSFSNQKLHAFMAHIDNAQQVSERVVISYPVDRSGIQNLLQELTCLQCRAVLLEWWLNTQ